MVKEQIHQKQTEVWKETISAKPKLKHLQKSHTSLKYGGPEVQNTKQTKQNKNYVSSSFLHYFDTFLPKT